MRLLRASFVLVGVFATIGCTPSRRDDDCSPACGERVCGADPVCGESCGVCTAPDACDESGGQCTGACVPDCAGRSCGLDPVCGSLCGTCESGTSCQADGTCGAPACTPDCGGRACGIDPACGVSCGRCGDAEVCNVDGQCVEGTPGNRPPVVSKVSLDPPTLVRGQSVAVEVTVSDPDGLNDLVVVGLTNRRGGTLASLSVTLSPGVYSGTISWDALDEDEPITFTTPTSRTLMARVIDGASHVVDQSFPVPLACEDTTDSACSGRCVDLSTDPGNCGACGRSAGTDRVCRNGVSTCPTGSVECAGSCMEGFRTETHCGSCNHACPAPTVPSDAERASGSCGTWGGTTWSCGVAVSFDTRVVCTTRCQQLGLRCLDTHAVYGPNYTYTNDDGCAVAPRATYAGEAFDSIVCFCY